MPFEYLHHVSEMGVLATAGTLEEVFAEAARGMLAIQVDPGGLSPTATVEVRAEGRDPEELLVEFLNALVAAQDLEGILLTDAAPPRITRDGADLVLTGAARGVAREVAAGRVETEVKAVTWYGLEVRETAGGFSARFVVDV